MSIYVHTGFEIWDGGWLGVTGVSTWEDVICTIRTTYCIHIW